MHKYLINEAQISLTIEPGGPLLIKAGDTGADPTRPDMEFVRTYHPNGERAVYLPGSSLKGVIRAHCERIVRSLDEQKVCNPLEEGKSCVGRKKLKAETAGDEAYRQSCFICQMFGNTVLAGHLRTADAYPVDPAAVRTEQRDGVAIDRVFGSVAVGPFQLEVVTSGAFQAKLSLHNFSLAQLGLIGLTLRDLKLGRVAIGFGKSRGLGRVKLNFDSLTIRYPTCEVTNGDVTLLNQRYHFPRAQLAGIGHFPDLQAYSYPVGQGEQVALPSGLQFGELDNGWGEAGLAVQGDQVEEIWRACMPAWREAMRL